MPRKSNYRLCIHDLILIAVLAAAAAILLGIFALARGSSPGKTVVITVNGQNYGTYQLDQEKTIPIETAQGNNTIVIQNGYVQMLEADCPDQYCISKGKISRSGETIVCLPHRVVAEIRAESSSEELEFDVISQ